MHEHTICMRSPLVLHLSLMNITSCHVSCLHVILIFISLCIMHIPNEVMFPCSLPYFMSYNSCCLHSDIPYNHAIIIQEQHIITCITYHIKLSSIHSIHSRSHHYVFKHNKLAYNLMTRANKQQLMRNLRRVSHLRVRP